MLGRPHEVRGVVAHGDKRGRELGFPTANVSVPGRHPAARRRHLRRLVRAARRRRCTPPPSPSGGGPRSTSEAHASLLEAHLLDFDGDLYDEHVRVRFVARLRGEERFDSVEALVDQISRDCDEARASCAL